MGTGHVSDAPPPVAFSRRGVPNRYTTSVPVGTLLAIVYAANPAKEFRPTWLALAAWNVRGGRPPGAASCVAAPLLHIHRASFRASRPEEVPSCPNQTNMKNM